MKLNIESDSIKKIFLNYMCYTFVAILGMSIATIVDGVIVGRFIGRNALAAVNLSFPITAFTLGLGLMVGIGGSTLIGVKTGEKDKKSVNEIFTVVISAILVVSIILIVIIFTFKMKIVKLLGANDEISALVLDYAIYITPFLLPFMLNTTLDNIFRVIYNPLFSMITIISCAIVNILLDLLFVGYFKFGLPGAAIATGVSQILSVVLFVFLYKTKVHYIKFKFPEKYFSTLAKVIKNGFSDFVNQFGFGLATLIINNVIIIRYGTIGVSAFSIVNYLSMFIFIFFMGCAYSLPAGISINWGAKKYSRVSGFLRMGLLTNFLFGVVAFASLMLLTGPLVSIFVDNDVTIIKLTNRIAKIYSFSFLTMGINLVFIVYYTSIQKALESAIIASLSVLVFRVLFIFLLPVLLGDIGIWYTIPLSEGITCFISILIFKNSNHKVGNVKVREKMIA